MSLPVAILAGGLATRLGPVTHRLPKVLVDVCGQPFAVHQIELLRRHGLREIVYLVGHLGEVVVDTLGDGSRWGVHLRYVFDGPTRLGTGGALQRALPELGEAFFVLYGDSYLECDYRAIESFFLSHSAKDGLMTVCRNDNQWDRSNVVFETGRIIRYDKSVLLPEMAHIDYGLGAFRATAFSGFGGRNSFDVAELYNDLLTRDRLAGFDVGGRFYEIGSPAGLEETRNYLNQRTTNS